MVAVRSMPVCPTIILPDDELITHPGKRSLLHLTSPGDGVVITIPNVVKQSCDDKDVHYADHFNNFVEILNDSPKTFASFLENFDRFKSCPALLPSSSPILSPTEELHLCRYLSSSQESGVGGEAKGKASLIDEVVISRDGIRVMLFRECERRGRKLLYDSATVVKVPAASVCPRATLHATHGRTHGAEAPLTTAPTRGLSFTTQSYLQMTIPPNPNIPSCAHTRPQNSTILQPPPNHPPPSVSSTVCFRSERPTYNSRIARPSSAVEASRPASASMQSCPLARGMSSSQPVVGGRREAHEDIVVEAGRQYAYQV